MILNRARFGKEKYQALLEHSLRYLILCNGLYTMHLENGVLDLHEHPQSATRWWVEQAKALPEREGVHKVVAPMCQYGRVSKDERRIGLVKKPTTFMANAPLISD